jgi:uncharacterized protein YggU (UPF0235/DUF167 family)
VVPRSSRATLTRDAAGIVRAHVTAAPVGGAANRALLALLAERLSLPRSAIEIVRGEGGRDKVVCVRGLAATDLEQRLAHVFNSAVDKGSRRG